MKSIKRDNAKKLNKICRNERLAQILTSRLNLLSPHGATTKKALFFTEDVRDDFSRTGFLRLAGLPGWAGWMRFGYWSCTQWLHFQDNFQARLGVSEYIHGYYALIYFQWECVFINVPIDDSILMQEHEGRCDFSSIKTWTGLIKLPWALDLEHQVSSVHIFHNKE